VPRPDATPEFIAAVESGYVRPAIFVEIHFLTGPVYVWSGAGSIAWGGVSWLDVGNFGSISPIEEGATVSARGITLSLSGVDPTLLSDVLNEYQQNLPAVIYFGVRDNTGALIPNPITSWAGRTDQPTITVDGESATISIACENRLVILNNSVERRYTDADQKRDYPDDRGFEFVNAIQNVTIYWGRHPDSSNNFSVQGHPD
jgi:hypothetical protein